MPTAQLEKQLLRQGFKFIAGVDEVGRGPLAGPLLAAAVILPLKYFLPGLNDSKKLSPKQREKLFVLISKQAIAIGVGRVDWQTIDKINIGRANLLGMELAVEELSCRPDFLLIDGARNRLDLPIPQKSINGGDGQCASIAAASIIAKVLRDRLMESYDAKFPEYGFARHKGYGTKLHLRRLAKHGPCPIHRRTFFPVSALA